MQSVCTSEQADPMPMKGPWASSFGRWNVALLGLFMCLTAPAAVSAEPSGPSSSETTSASSSVYDQLIEEAVREFRLGNYPEARSLFERAHAVRPNARTLRGMGMAAFEERSYVLAIQYLKASLADQRKPLSDKQREQVQDVLARAQGFIAQYELELTPRDAEVTVDSRPPVIVDGTLLLDPGTHELVVSIEGKRERRRVRAQPNERLVLRIRLTNKGDGDTAEAKATTEGLSTRRKWAIATGAVGAAGLATSLGLTLRARSLRDGAGCRDGVCPNADATAKHEKAFTTSNAATAMLGVGVAAAAAGLTLWLWPGAERPQEEEKPKAQSKGSSARLTPVVSRDFAGVSLGGTF